jgi:Putative adhesin
MLSITTISFKRIACVALLAAFCLIGACGPSGDSNLEEISDRRYPIDPKATMISVTNRDGSIRIYGAGGDVHEIRVEAVKKAYTTERLKAISVIVSQQPDSISIQTIYPPDLGRTFSDRSGTVDYVIVVPQSARVSKLELGKGELLIEEMRSTELHAQLGSGRLFVHNCFGNVDANVRIGNVALAYEWWEHNKFSIHAAVDDGNVFAFLPGEATFHLIAHTITGKISNDFEEQEERRAKSVSQIDALVGGVDQPKIEIETHDGNIRIAQHNP